MAKIRVVLADKNLDMVAIVSRTLGEEFEVVSSVAMASRPSRPFTP